MFTSAISILEKYVDHITPYGFYEMEMRRGENTEDLYYLCHSVGGRYIVFETDYVAASAYPAREAAQLFAPAGAQPLYWLVKKDRADYHKNYPLDVALGDNLHFDILVSELRGSYLKHAVLAVTPETGHLKRYDPNVYG